MCSKNDCITRTILLEIHPLPIDLIQECTVRQGELNKYASRNGIHPLANRRENSDPVLVLTLYNQLG